MTKHTSMNADPTRIMFGFIVLGLLVLGCAEARTSNNPSTTTKGSETPSSEYVGHDHPSEGPHGGELIELGSEEFHAELLHNSDASDAEITIYILDSSAMKMVPIEADEITVNVTADGKPQQFTLAANREAGGSGSSTARFDSSDKQLIQFLDDHDAKAQLAAKIQGTAYRGEIAHNHERHDHDGHGHGGSHQHKDGEAHEGHDHD